MFPSAIVGVTSSLVGPCRHSVVSKFPMITSARPLLTILLTSVVLLGHIPGWLHVTIATQQSTVERHSASGTTVSDISSRQAVCCCHHHQSQRDADCPSGVPQDGSQDSDHDSCVLCQSLTATIGSVDVAQGHQPVALLADFSPSFDFISIVEPWDLVSQPRGPPTLLS